MKLPLYFQLLNLTHDFKKLSEKKHQCDLLSDYLSKRKGHFSPDKEREVIIKLAKECIDSMDTFSLFYEDYFEDMLRSKESHDLMLHVGHMHDFGTEKQLATLLEGISYNLLCRIEAWVVATELSWRDPSATKQSEDQLLKYMRYSRVFNVDDPNRTAIESYVSRSLYRTYGNYKLCFDFCRDRSMSDNGKSIFFRDLLKEKDLDLADRIEILSYISFNDSEESSQYTFIMDYSRESQLRQEMLEDVSERVVNLADSTDVDWIQGCFIKFSSIPLKTLNKVVGDIEKEFMIKIIPRCRKLSALSLLGQKLRTKSGYDEYAKQLFEAERVVPHCVTQPLTQSRESSEDTDSRVG